MSQKQTYKICAYNAVGLNLRRLCLRLPVVPVYYPEWFSSLSSLRWVSTYCSELAYFYKLLPTRLERTLAVKHAAIAAFDKGALAGAVIIFGGVVVVVVAATKFAVIVAVADGAAVAVACVAVAVADFHAKYLAYIRCVLTG